MFAIGGRPPCAARKREASRLLALNIEHARVAPSDAARPRMDLRQIYRVDGQPVGDPRAVRGPEGRAKVAPGSHSDGRRSLTGGRVDDQDLRLPRDASRLLLEGKGESRSAPISRASEGASIGLGYRRAAPEWSGLPAR